MIIQNRSIICFGEDWSRHPNTLESLVRLVAPHNKVLWVNTLGHKTPRLRLKDIKRSLEKVRAALNSSRNQDEVVAVLRPLGIPWHDSRIVRRLNGYLLTFLVRRKMRALGMSRPILITNSPVMIEVLGKLGETVAAYYCVDDYAAFDGAPRQMRQLEEAMLARVDIAFYLSEVLRNQKRVHPPRIQVIAQPVNYEHFVSAHRENRPDALSDVPRPIIGYLGLVETTNWLDLELLHEIAQRQPQWSFVLIGPIQADIAQYRDNHNMRFLGGVSYAEVPSYVNNFDVGLIPRKLNQLTMACNPVKLLEYFSLGIPVVSSPLPSVMAFGNLVRIAETAVEFEHAIMDALKNDTPSHKEMRRQVAESHSWNKAVDYQFGEILRSETERRHPPV